MTGAQILIGRCVREIGLLALYYSAQYVRRRAPADIPRSAMRCRRSRRLWRREMKLHRSQLHLVVSRQLLLVTPPSPPQRSIVISVFVCLLVREHISGTTRVIFAELLVRVTRVCGSVLLCRRCNDTLCTTGFVDDVIFAHICT